MSSKRVALVLAGSVVASVAILLLVFEALVSAPLNHEKVDGVLSTTEAALPGREIVHLEGSTSTDFSTARPQVVGVVACSDSCPDDRAQLDRRLRAAGYSSSGTEVARNDWISRRGDVVITAIQVSPGRVKTGLPEHGEVTVRQPSLLIAVKSDRS